jgi:hypothetical protein
LQNKFEIIYVLLRTFKDYYLVKIFLVELMCYILSIALPTSPTQFVYRPFRNLAFYYHSAYTNFIDIQ